MTHALLALAPAAAPAVEPAGSTIFAAAADVLTVSLLLLGVGFNLIASIGLLRMPDLYNRMQSATKSSTLGIACVAAACAIHFGTPLAIIEAGLVIMFFFATAPISSHLIGRAAYGIGVPLDARTVRDDLAEAHAESARRRRQITPALRDRPPMPTKRSA